MCESLSTVVHVAVHVITGGGGFAPANSSEPVVKAVRTEGSSPVFVMSCRCRVPVTSEAQMNDVDLLGKRHRKCDIGDKGTSTEIAPPLTWTSRTAGPRE